MHGNRVKLKLRVHRPPGRAKDVAVRPPAKVQATAAGRPRARHDVLLRLLVACGLFALAFYGINAGWLCVRSVEVRGSMSLSDGDVIELAALENLDGIWTICIPRELIRSSLEADPLIEHAEIHITGPWSLRIEITERRALAAVEYAQSKFLFDRTGELIDILLPDETCLCPIVRGVPPGLLRYRGVPLHLQAETWSLPRGCDVDTMNLQFDRLIHLQHLLRRYAGNRADDLRAVCMDPRGRLTVEFNDCAPILLGDFLEPELQVRRMLAVLGDESITDPKKTIDIDLSSEQFPCYHVRASAFTKAELQAIADWKKASEGDGNAGAGPAPQTVAVSFNPDIFKLAGGDTSDDDSQQ